MATKDTTTCPSCGKAASGRFCSHCGSPLAGTTCAGCDAPLAPGAKFCHRCGTPVGATPAAARRHEERRGLADILPWAVAGVALVALVVMLAGQRGRGGEGGAGGFADTGTPLSQMGGPGGGSAGDISSMSPRERASRLFDRVMRYESEGKQDSLQFFAPMAVQSYLMLDSLDLDARYDLGRIAAATGADSVALAQADTMLRQHPNHLLALALGARAARGMGNEAKARDFDRLLLAAAPAEEQKALPEYQGHRTDLDSALAMAKRKQ
ncbi:MAG TPA: zinc ribbon domain-containing protein [Gemmatimonadaceae bacterium]|nr:zinc ribbon domain-containing protein [Gemmatimonadaceae bacterium]